MIVGVGGQGVLMISKALALIGQKQGFEVKQSEVHGMAKRGGVVFSHVRFGEQVWSPTIAKGEADALIALEWAEGLRWLDYLRPSAGVFIADTRRIVPPFACRNRKPGAATRYAQETPAEIADKVAESYALDATTIATESGRAPRGQHRAARRAVGVDGLSRRRLALDPRLPDAEQDAARSTARRSRPAAPGRKRRAPTRRCGSTRLLAATPPRRRSRRSPSRSKSTPPGARAATSA